MVLTFPFSFQWRWDPVTNDGTTLVHVVVMVTLVVTAHNHSGGVIGG